MRIPGEIAQWASAGTLVGSIVGVAWAIYQWLNYARKRRQAEDEQLEIKANRMARIEFTLEDHTEALEDHGHRIVELEKGK